MSISPSKRRTTLSAILAIRKAARRIDDIVDSACRSVGITGVQYNILRILSAAPPEGISRSTIVQNLIEQHADVTRSIDGLVASGCVEREHATHDRRVVLHRLTMQGHRLLEQLDPILSKALEEISHTFTKDELDTLTTLCERFFKQSSTSQAAPTER